MTVKHDGIPCSTCLYQVADPSCFVRGTLQRSKAVCWTCALQTIRHLRRNRSLVDVGDDDIDDEDTICCCGCGEHPRKGTCCVLCKGLVARHILCFVEGTATEDGKGLCLACDRTLSSAVESVVDRQSEVSDAVYLTQVDHFVYEGPIFVDPFFYYLHHLHRVKGDSDTTTRWNEGDVDFEDKSSLVGFVEDEKEEEEEENDQKELADEVSEEVLDTEHSRLGDALSEE